MAKSKSKGDRDITFRLGIAEHPATKEMLSRLKSQALDVQKGIETSATRAMASIDHFNKAGDTFRKLDQGAAQFERRLTTMTTQLERFNAQLDRTRQLASGIGGAVPRTIIPPRLTIDGPPVDRTKRLVDRDGINVERVADRTRRSSALQEIRAQKGRARSEERAWDNLQKQNRINERIADQELNRDESRRLKAVKEQDRIHHRHRQRQRSTAKQNRTTRTKLGNTITRSYARVESSQRAMVGRASELAEGLGRAARGFAMLGIAGEENTEKLLRQLVKVQAGFDLVVGTVKTAASVMDMMRLHRDTVNALAAASTAGAMLQGGTRAAARGVLARVGTAAGSGAIGAGGAAGLGVGGLIVPAAAGIAAAGSGALAGKVVLDTARGVRDFGFGGGVQHGTITDKIATAEASMLAKFERLSRPVLGAVAHPVFREVNDSADIVQRSQARLAASQAAKEQLEKVGEGRARARSMEDEKRDRQSEQQIEMHVRAFRPSTTASDRARIIRQEMQDREGLSAQRLFGNVNAQRLDQVAVSRLRRSERETLTAPSEEVQTKAFELDLRQRTNSAEMVRAKTELLRLSRQSNVADSDKIGAEQRLKDLQGERRRLAMNELDLKKQITAENRKSSEAIIQGIREEIASRQQSTAEVARRFTAAREAFGAMDPTERMRALQVKQRINRERENIEQTGFTSTQQSEMSQAEAHASTLRSQLTQAEKMAGDPRKQLEAFDDVRGKGGIVRRQNLANQRLVALRAVLEQEENARDRMRGGVAQQRELFANEAGFLSDFQRREQMGSQHVSEAERGRASQIEERRRSMLAGSLNPQEARVLGSVGTGFERDVSRRAFGAIADRAGFGRHFGEEERQQFGANARDMQQFQNDIQRRAGMQNRPQATAALAQEKLQVELKDKREVEVKVNQNTEATANLIVSKVLPILANNNVALLKMVEDKLARNNQNQSDVRNRR